jgi:hypothetical protein
MRIRRTAPPVQTPASGRAFRPVLLAAVCGGPFSAPARLRGFAGNSMSDAEESNMKGRPTTPWVRQVISGVDLMGHPKYNKVTPGRREFGSHPGWTTVPDRARGRLRLRPSRVGDARVNAALNQPACLLCCAQGMAFTESERERLYLRGLMPPAILSQVRVHVDGM